MTSTALAVPRWRRPQLDVLRRLWLGGIDGLARTGYVCLALLIVASIILPIGSLAGNPQTLVGPRLQPPGGSWLFGTDNLGRSLLPRVVQGLGTTLTLSVVAVAVTVVVSTTVGIVAGYLGGAVSELFLRLTDVLYAFPALILAILVSALIGFGRISEVVSIVLVTFPLMTRVVRASALSVARKDYVRSAKISGASTARILLRHVLPNVAGTVTVQATYALSVAMLVEGGLSFLGLGVQPPQASLGSLIQQGSLYVIAAPWLVVAPGVTFLLAILSINVLGDGLRDLLDPQEVRSLT